MLAMTRSFESEELLRDDGWSQRATYKLQLGNVAGRQLRQRLDRGDGVEVDASSEGRIALGHVVDGTARNSGRCRRCHSVVILGQLHGLSNSYVVAGILFIAISRCNFLRRWFVRHRPNRSNVALRTGGCCRRRRRCCHRRAVNRKLWVNLDAIHIHLSTGIVIAAISHCCVCVCCHHSPEATVAGHWIRRRTKVGR